MKQEILLALVAKIVEERINSLPQLDPLPGPRGPRGPRGEGFSLDIHGEEIKKWVEESKLKFSDLSKEDKETLIGPKGDPGENGKDGKDGEGFVFEVHREEINSLVKSYVDSISPDLKLRFSDLTEEEKLSLRGPRGQRGKPGKGFNLDEHKEFFDSLRPVIDYNQLKLKFSDLTENEIEELKLHFSDLTEEEKLSLRGPRGQRGKQGPPGQDSTVPGPRGEKGEIGPMGPAGAPGICFKGAAGRDGKDGTDGLNGKDAPKIVDVRVERAGKDIYFIFEFEDLTYLKTNNIPLPQGQAGYTIMPVVQSGGGSATEATNLKIRKIATSTITKGKAVKPDSDTHVSPADNNTTLSDATVLGVAETDANAGEEVSIILLGTLSDASFIFTVNQLLFLGVGGNIVTTPSSHLYLTPVGKALGNGLILVSIGLPVGVI